METLKRRIATWPGSVSPHQWSRPSIMPPPQLPANFYNDDDDL
jgi:hypothetical protein